MTEIRAFVAVKPGSGLCAWLDSVLARLSGRYPGVRWVRPGNVHLTLQFLGSVAEERVPLILQAMEEAAVDTPPLTIELAEAGGFGRKGSPRTYWISLREGARLDRLRSVQGRLESSLQELGWKAEKRSWTPHLTLGRNPRQKRTPGWEDCLGGNRTPPPLTVDRITLFASELTPRGAIYHPLGSAPLGGDGGTESVDGPCQIDP